MRMHLIDFGVKKVKGQDHGAWLIVIGFWTKTESVINI